MKMATATEQLKMVDRADQCPRIAGWLSKTWWDWGWGEFGAGYAPLMGFFVCAKSRKMIGRHGILMPLEGLFCLTHLAVHSSYPQFMVGVPLQVVGASEL